jgi:hypothetical protein
LEKLSDASRESWESQRPGGQDIRAGGADFNERRFIAYNVTESPVRAAEITRKRSLVLKLLFRRALRGFVFLGASIVKTDISGQARILRWTLRVFGAAADGELLWRCSWRFS